MKWLQHRMNGWGVTVLVQAGTADEAHKEKNMARGVAEVWVVPDGENAE